MKKALLVTAALVLLLSGCGPAPDPHAPPDCRVVTRIEVSYQRGSAKYYRSYTSPEKLHRVLNYLRSLDPRLPPALDPDAVPGHTCQITLTYSDGAQTVYRQKADQYLQIDGAGWRRIKPGPASKVAELIRDLPSDQ